MCCFVVPSQDCHSPLDSTRATGSQDVECHEADQQKEAASGNAGLHTETDSLWTRGPQGKRMENGGDPKNLGRQIPEVPVDLWGQIWTSWTERPQLFSGQ